MVERILVTPRSLTLEPHPEVERLRKAGFDIVYSTPGALPGEEELKRLLPDCVGWLAGVEPVSDDTIQAARALRVISRNGVGVDNLPLAALAERGIEVMIAQGANAIGVAELTIGLLLASLRSIPFSDRGIKSGGWPRRRGVEVRDRSIGIVGCGVIGREVARMVLALGAKALAFEPKLPNVDLPSSRFRFASFEEVIANADVVTLHCPALPGGRPLVDEAAIGSMKSGAFLINTARASLVSESALAAALESGRLAGYATDVFEEEPPRDRRLARRDNVIATSHIGGFTDESVDRATSIAAANLLKVLRPERQAGG